VPTKTLNHAVKRNAERFPPGFMLMVSQRTIDAYEVGRRRMPVSSFPVIARQQRFGMQVIDTVLAQQAR
jgi:hypothetical protein